MIEKNINEVVQLLNEYITAKTIHQSLAIVSNTKWTFNTAKRFLDSKQDAKVGVWRHRYAFEADNLVYFIQDVLIPHNKELFMDLLKTLVQYANSREKSLVILFEDLRTSSNERVHCDEAIKWIEESDLNIEICYSLGHVFSNEIAID